MWATYDGDGAAPGRKTRKTRRKLQLQAAEPEPEPEPEVLQSLYEEWEHDGVEEEDVEEEDEEADQGWDEGRTRSSSSPVASLSDHISRAQVVREPVDLDGRRLTVGHRVRVEHGKYSGKEGELVMLDEAKIVIIVPERGHRDAKRVVLMSTAQPEKTCWALSTIVLEKPVEPPPPPRERAVSTVTGRVNRHARPRSASSPPPRPRPTAEADASQVQQVQQVQPSGPRPRWNSSTAPAAVPLAPDTLARSVASDEWSDSGDADGSVSMSSSQRARSALSHRGQSRRRSESQSSNTSQRSRSDRPAHTGGAAAPPTGGQTTHDPQARHAWGLSPVQRQGLASADSRVALITELVSWSAHSRELISVLREFSAREEGAAVEQAALQRESHMLAIRVSDAADHGTSFCEWLSKAATQASPSPQLDEYVKAAVSAAPAAVAAAPLPEGLRQVQSLQQNTGSKLPSKQQASRKSSNGQHTTSTTKKTASGQTKKAKRGTGSRRAEIVSPSRLSGIPRPKPVTSSAIAESLSTETPTDAVVGLSPPAITAVAVATAAFAERKQAAGGTEGLQGRFEKQKPLQKNSQGKARRAKTASSPKRTIKRPLGAPVAIAPPGLGWDGHSPTGTVAANERLPPARKPPAAVLSAAAREHKQRKQAAKAAGPLDRDKAKGLTMRQFQRLRVQQNAQGKLQRAAQKADPDEEQEEEMEEEKEEDYAETEGDEDTTTGWATESSGGDDTTSRTVDMSDVDAGADEEGTLLWEEQQQDEGEDDDEGDDDDEEEEEELPEGSDEDDVEGETDNEETQAEQNAIRKVVQREQQRQRQQQRRQPAQRRKAAAGQRQQQQQQQPQRQQRRQQQQLGQHPRPQARKPSNIVKPIRPADLQKKKASAEEDAKAAEAAAAAATAKAQEEEEAAAAKAREEERAAAAAAAAKAKEEAEAAAARAQEEAQVAASAAAAAAKVQETAAAAAKATTKTEFDDLAHLMADIGASDDDDLSDEEFSSEEDSADE
jgi:hypothetical protein